MSRKPIIAATLLAVIVGLVACGDDESETSPAELKESLPAAQDLGLETEREFEWDNATDFVAQGVFYSEQTKPSELIDAMDDAGFESGVGAGLVQPEGELHLFTMVAEFESEDGAVEARDTLHAEDLKQPCFAACAVTPEEYEVEGIPDSVAVHHVPNEGDLPPGLFPFEGYLLEFTAGPRLYVVNADGPPGFMSAGEFDEAATTMYEEAAASG